MVNCFIKVILYLLDVAFYQNKLNTLCRTSKKEWQQIPYKIRHTGEQILMNKYVLKCS